MRLWGARVLIHNRNQMIRLSRQFLEADKGELDRIIVENINSVQALVLSNVGRGGFAVRSKDCFALRSPTSLKPNLLRDRSKPLVNRSGCWNGSGPTIWIFPAAISTTPPLVPRIAFAPPQFVSNPPASTRWARASRNLASALLSI